jgi:hypothetical protein
MTNNPAKEYLRSIRKIVLEEKSLLAEYERLVHQIGQIRSVSLVDPGRMEDAAAGYESDARIGRARKRSHRHTDPTGDLASALADRLASLEAVFVKCTALRKEAEGIIECLPPDQRTIVREYYLMGNTWAGAAVAAAVSQRSCYRKHGDLLVRLNETQGRKIAALSCAAREARPIAKKN